MDTDMDFEQGGSADALAIFQEAFNAQQHPLPPTENDRKMLYVHPLLRGHFCSPSSRNVTLQRSRLCARLHWQPRVLHLLRDEEHPTHLRQYLSIGQAAGPRGPARRPRRLS